MDDVQHFETSLSDVADGLELEAGVVFTLVVFGVQFELLFGMREDPVPLALTDIESLAVSWIDQPVYVIAQRLVDFLGKAFSGHGSVVGVVVEAEGEVKFLELDFPCRPIGGRNPVVINGVDGPVGVELDNRVAFAVRATAL